MCIESYTQFSESKAIRPITNQQFSRLQKVVRSHQICTSRPPYFNECLIHSTCTCCQHTHPVNLLAISLQQNNYAATFSMSNFSSLHFPEIKQQQHKEHLTLQEHLLLLCYSGKVLKSRCIVWRAFTSINSADIPVLQNNTDFLLQHTAGKAELHNCL